MSKSRPRLPPLRPSAKGPEQGGGDVDERRYALAELAPLRAEGDERHGVARVAALADGLDVAVVGRHDDRDAGGLRAADERREEPVVRPQHRARARVVHRMPRDVRLEELVEREVVLARDPEKVLRRALGRDDRDVGVAVLYRLARKVLHERAVLHQVGGDAYRLGRRERHDGRHRLEPPRGKLVGGVDEVRIGEAHLLAHLAKREEEVVALDDLAELLPGEALAVAPHRGGAVYAGEHRRLACRRLRRAVDAEARVNRLGIVA